MLRRPMMYITSAFCASVLTAYYSSALKTLIFIGLSALFLFPGLKVKEQKVMYLLIVLSMVSGTLCYLYHDIRDSLFMNDIGNKVTTVCTVLQTEEKVTTGFDGEKNRYMQLVVYVDMINGIKCDRGEKIVVKYYKNSLREDCGNSDCEDVILGSKVSIEGNVSVPDGRRNPGCFDYALYLKSIGIEHIIIAEKIGSYKVQEGNHGLNDIFAGSMSCIYMMKESFLDAVEKHAGCETAGMVRAVMFGEEMYLDEEVLKKFRKNGTAHVLAVSGLHIGIIYRFINSLWGKKRGKLYFIFTAMFFLTYMVMASFAPSVVRAVIMVWLHMYAQFANKRYDMASAAFFTALVMLVARPMSIFNVGFQMSFLAVLTLSLLLPLIKQFYSGIFLAGAAIQFGLAPYTIFVFNYFSIAALFINVPIIFLTGIIVPVGICSMLFMAVFQPLGAIMVKSMGGLCIVMEKLNEITCIEGITVFDIRSPDLWIIASYYLILLFFVSEDGRIMIMRKKKMLIKRMVCVVTAATLMFSIAAGNHFKNSDMIFVDVGQGDCIHMRTDKNMIGIQNNYLFDGGGSIRYEVGRNTLKPYLLKNGVKKIDGAFVTHLHTDHYKGITELCREGMIERLYVFEGYRVKESRILDDTGLSKEQITYLHAGQRVRLGRDAYADILWPEASNDREYERMTADEEDENDLCLIMKITVKDRSLIVTGDVDSACLDSLTERYGETLEADILKAAHHGSKYSDSAAFAEAAKPKYAVFQVGKNNFGHPDQGVIENFRQKGIMIYRNDLDGAVAFDIDRKGRIKARSVKGE